MKKHYAIASLLALPTLTIAQTSESLRVATFNVSMEALNYLPYNKNNPQKPTGNELLNALKSQHPQIKNIAKIIKQHAPDIILLNEFDRNNRHYQESLALFLNEYLNTGDKPIKYAYTYQGPVNTGILSNVDMNGNNKVGDVPADTYGFGHFPGHFGMALLSKYPIDTKGIRTFQLFKWKDMPNALLPMNSDNTPYYNDEAWQAFRLSSKSHWDVPVKVGNTTIHILASHPTPPVFDGEEDRNGKRNHDEIRLLNDYITPNKGQYLYDDDGTKGGLGANKRFVILGDLNASKNEGDAINSGIGALLDNALVQDVAAKSLGGKKHRADNPNAQYHTAYWGMRADYVLPSSFGLNVTDSGVFWPEKTSKEYYLIKDRAASSDHRMVWLDLNIVE